MSFLHFEAHGCCMNILFYNFHMDFIEFLGIMLNRVIFDRLTIINPISANISTIENLNIC